MRIEPTLIRNTLYSMHTSSGASDEYRKGILVGVMGVLTALGMTYTDALKLCASYLPDTGTRISPKSVPQCWFVDLGKEMTRLGKTYICSI